MSIFKDTFKKDIQDQLKVRQDAIHSRTPDAIQYFNARNSWIRMSSSVNVHGTNELAKKYVLQGGVLRNGKLKSGVGNTGKENYSIATPDDTINRLGIRPMPGITGIEVKSKSAYGSLREVTVTFNAWDIRQLEELELLYMRPGYTVLIEWGWAPYLDNTSKLTYNPGFYDILDSSPSKEQIFKDLYNTAVKEHKGNYDAHFGYIKNYSWNARPDGGYDCTTNIISVGEVMESLKVNYSPFGNIKAISSKGLFSSKIPGIDISAMSELSSSYSQNILAGAFYELYQIGMQKMEGTQDEGKSFVFYNTEKGSYYDMFKKTININGGKAEASSNGKIGASDEQIYITLETLCNLLNDHVIFKDSNSNTSFVSCSVLEREYDKDALKKPNPLTGEGYLLCLAHPLQISVDPTVCAIKSPLWVKGFNINPAIVEAINASGSSVVIYDTTTPASTYDNLISTIKTEIEASNTDEEKLIKEMSSVLQGDINKIKELSRRWYLTNPTKDLYSYLDDGLTGPEIQAAVGDTTSGSPQLSKAALLKYNPATLDQMGLDAEKEKLKNVQTDTIKNLEYLNSIPRPYFYQDNYSTELGIIGNIYVNLNFLYRLALDNNLESQDKKEKNDINLYDFLKSTMTEISSAIGNVSNFDIHVDPIDNKIRIIDVNYVDYKSRQEVYNNLFQLEVHNTKSTVRSYKLESQIFQDQSTVISIGAQVGGGALATDNNTLLDFNKGITDRIIPKKIDPTLDPNKSLVEANKEKLENVIISLKSLYEFFGKLDYGWFTDADFDADQAGNYKNSLKDLINFFKNLTFSNIKNRSIIPTKISIDMDGIGGLVIGHMFKIPPELLPKGYKGGEGPNDIGAKLGYVVTGIGHSLKSNDWTTNIDAQTIILDEPSGSKLKFEDIITQKEGKTSTKSANDIIKSTTRGTQVMTKVICGQTRNNGDIDDLLVKIKPELWARHASTVNQSDNKQIRLQPLAMESLEKLLTDAYNQGILLKVNSAYRTYGDQLRIKQSSSTIPCATPGWSNHGFGLAVDLANSTGARINPAKTPKEWKWIQANKDKYKFYNLNDSSESHHYNWNPGQPGKIC